MSQLYALLGLLASAAALNPSCSPGGNFDLTKWNLQLPTGSTGSPQTISGSSLAGCSGYSSSVFYTDGSTGELVMTVPGSPSSAGCVTTPNSKHCRTEFREISPSSWSPNNGNNRLRVTLSVPQPDDSSHGTVIGQIHIDDSISSKPVCELFYSSSGQITMGVERTRAGGELLYTTIATIPVGTSFTYEIRYESAQLSVAVNDGGFVQLSQYELANPNSYFKVGNYNQGDSYSEVRIQSITVTHGSAASNTGSAHPVSTISVAGIGPREVLYALDATVKPYPSPTGACAAAPTKYSDSTVNLRLYYEDNCCHDVETAHIGTFNVCHNSDGPFASIEQAVGANLFDRGIHIVAWDGLDCTGGSTSFSLSNSKGCQAVTSGTRYQSFMISEPQTCAVTGPAIASDNTVTMELYSDVGCCTTVETIKMGNTGTCHEADAAFHSFSQAVGTNEFGWNIHIHTFTESGCQGTYDSFSLSNAATCNKNGVAWKSFMIAQDCARHDLTAKNDNTVSLALYRDGECCVFNGEDIDLGTVGSCHNANDKFGSITQAVGQNMFGKNVHVQLFEGADCTGTMKDHSLTNADGWCSAGGVDEEFQSFWIKKQCDTHELSVTGSYEVALAFWQDGNCCEYQTEAQQGRFVIGECRNTEAPFGSVTQAVGQDVFGNNIHIQVYEGLGCTGSSKRFSLTNADGWCSDGGVAEQYQSYSIAPECGWKDPANTNANTVTIELYSDVSCCSYVSETVLGVASTCHNAPSSGSVAGMGIGAGSSWDGALLELYGEKDCAGDFKYFELSGDLAGACAVTGGVVASWRLVESQQVSS